MGDGTFSTNTNPIHEFPGPGEFLVTLYIENQYGCKDTTDKLVKVNPTYAIWIPNVFTPDGDGVNEFFTIDGFGIQEVDLRIFDRWGVQLFHKAGPQEDVVWNGIYKGDVVQQDVYVYKVRIKDIFNKYHDIVGRVTVIK
jgi:gliding motility-associated-like protein